MTEKVEVVYIGEKPLKRLTVYGKKYLFPRLKVVAIEAEAAYHLLDIPTVFATPEDAETKIQKMKDEEAAREAAIQAEEDKRLAEVKENSFVVLVDGEQVDISKHTIGKMKAIIEAEELEIVAERKSAGDLRKEVRDALHQKHGNPEV